MLFPDHALRAPARHDGLVRVATLLAFVTGQRLAARPRRCNRPLRTPGHELPWVRPSAAGVRALARGNRLLVTTLHAFIVVVEERALSTDDPGAVIAIGLVAVLA